MQDWDSFFATLGQIAVTIFAIAFALYQYKQPSWSGEQRKQFTVFIGFGEFWLSAIFSFLMLTPAQPWKVASIVIGSVGLLSLATHYVLHWSLTYRGHFADAFDMRILRLSPISLFVYSSFLASGILAIKFDWDQTLYVSAFAALWLIVSGSFEAAWHLRY